MELGGSSSSPQEAVAPLGVLGAGPKSSSLEKLKVLPIGPGAHQGAPGSPASAGDSYLGEPSGAMKIPNRDSGIDSPSSSVASENFPCEEGSEGSPGPAILRLHPETAVDSQVPQDTTAQEEKDNGLGEDPDPKITPSRPEENVGLTQCSDPQKLLHIAQELLHTEEAYVRRLHLLDQVFCTKMTEAGIPPEVTTGIFSNISSIYRFHGQFLLPELQKRITEEWDTNPRLGDILQKLAPFLKMYGEYVKNFDRAMGLVSTWTQRSPQFSEVVHSIQKQEVCGNLTLQHHMLEPVQRIPRYELLLKDYLKRLPRDAPDRKDAERSLELISTAADHSNAAIRKMEKMHKLLEVYEQLGGEEDIVNPANELIKEGNIQKLSAKNGTAQDRHLFLVSQAAIPATELPICLLRRWAVLARLRSPRRRFFHAPSEGHSQGSSKIFIPPTEVRLCRRGKTWPGLPGDNGSRSPDGQVQDIAKPNAARTFIITGRKRSLELQTRTEEEKKEWIQVIQATVEKHKQKSETFRAFSSACSQDEEPGLSPDQPITSASSVETTGVADSNGGPSGTESRKLSSKTRRDKEKPGCKSCGETFNSITKRKHRCKLCGEVICRKCSEFKAENSKQNRVCRECFLEEPLVPANPNSETPTELKESAEKPPSVHPRLCSTLRLSDNGTAWSDVWADIRESDPQVLDLLEGSQAGRLLYSISLSGCTITVPDPQEGLETGCVWKLHQGPRTWWLSAPSAKLRQSWLEALGTAACGDTTGDRPGAAQPQASASTDTP
ncbi:FYVE, RhoGEF and PH domain-containing protein 3 [Alexandromys fortis]|uniref:FYVE, RhoGEF and PH domain-containing protein 3 n=1 Tax=Alexandromys fortis TaxID=100897 RepID=UPI002152640F|nr:FYVE, RhoGEF and PH domain-containing protein 3 [Microtus fortis]